MPGKENSIVDYGYYISFYALGLEFLNIGLYFIFGIYLIDLFKIKLNDIARIGIATGLVFICNIIFILITGWFTIWWALFFAVLEFLFTCSMRFVFTISRINSDKARQEEVKTEEE